MTLFYSFLISFLVVFFIMPFYIKIMLKYRILDNAGGRKIHSGNKVNIGGSIIYLGFLVAYIISLPFLASYDDIDLTIVFISVITCMIIVGIRDDMNSLSAKTKLVIEVILILFLCRMGLVIDNLYGFLGIYELPVWVSYCITIFFYVVILNTYNLIDGIDGQAATQALINFIPLLLFFIFMVPGIRCENIFGSVFFWSLICVGIIGGLLAFLYFNWEPSKVFMGDTGSISIGILLASVMVAAINYNGHYGDEIKIFGSEIKSNIGVVVVLFFLPLADTLRVFCARLNKKKSPFSPDKSHIHHFFIRTGASHKTTTLTTLTFSIITSIIGIALSTIVNDNIFIPLFAILFFIYVIVLHLITKSRIKTMKAKKLCQKN